MALAPSTLQCMPDRVSLVPTILLQPLSTTDGDALLLKAVDHRGGLTRRLAACFTNHRNPRRCEHSLQCLPAQRLFGLVLGYEDLCDYDRFRDDSLLALAGAATISAVERLAGAEEPGPSLASGGLAATVPRFPLSTWRAGAAGDGGA